MHVNGFGNSKRQISQMRTIRRLVTDDSGVHRDIIIPNTYYILNCEVRLLSPQHWDQEIHNQFPIKDGTWCATYKDRVILQWSQNDILKQF
jgi:hypothetical protein